MNPRSGQSPGGRWAWLVVGDWAKRVAFEVAFELSDVFNFKDGECQFSDRC